MNFTRIEYFLAAAKYLNFTKAANVVYISQPSLSKQIALLEDELGVALFDRKPRALQLTPAGKLLFNEFNRLMPEIEAITEKVKRMKKDRLDTLFVGFVESIYLGEAAAKLIRDFSANATNVDMLIERHGFEALHNKIIDGSIDIAFTFSTQIGKMKDIMSAEIEPRQRYIIMSTEHRLAELDEIGIDDLRGETFALHGKSEPLVLCDDIIEECGKRGFYPKIRYAPSVDSILDYLELAGCIAFLDKSIIENRLGRLKYYPTSMKKQFSLVCVWKKNNRNPALKEFIKYLPEGAVVG